MTIIGTLLAPQILKLMGTPEAVFDKAIINVILDLLFVVVFKIGIAGTDIATVIAQGVSVYLAFYNLSHTADVHRVNFKKVKIHKDMLREILPMGIPSEVQNSVIALANVVVQSNINSFGAAAVAGCGFYSRIEGFAFIPITSFVLSMTTFIGQNLESQNMKEQKRYLFWYSYINYPS